MAHNHAQTIAVVVLLWRTLCLLLAIHAVAKSNALTATKHDVRNAGRSDDQFCVYVANRLVIPSLRAEQLALFATGELNLDRLTKAYIRERLEYQFAVVETSGEAYSLERQCRDGLVFGAKPLLNPG